MGSIITKHKYCNTYDYRINIDDSIKIEDIEKTIHDCNFDNIRNMILNKVLIICVKKNRINEFQEYIKNCKPFNEYQLYCLDLKKKDKEYYCYSYSLNKIPVIQENNIAVSCNAVITFNYKNNLYLILVKDKSRNFYSNLGGGCNYNEKIELCIKREIYEELGLIINNDAVFNLFANTNKKVKIPVLGTSIRITTYSFNIILSEKNILNWMRNKKMLNFFNHENNYNIFKVNNEEIDKIAIVRVNKDILVNNTTKIGNNFISECSLDLIAYTCNKFYYINDVIFNRTCMINKMIFYNFS